MRHYWKYVYETWIQPVLTSNVSYGYVHSEDGEQDGWQMYDGTTENDFNTYTKPNLLMWDLPDDIKVTAIDFYNCWSGGNQTTRQIKLYADNSRLKPLTDVITVNGGSRALTHIDIPVENQQFSKYFSVDFVASNYQIVGSSLTNITAQKRTAVEATPDDYDFYTDDDVITGVKKGVKHYWKYLYKSYTLPTMTSATAPSGQVNSNFNTGEYTNAPYKMFFNQSDWHYDNWANRGDNKYNEYVFQDFLKEGTYTLSFTAYRQANPTTPEYRFIIKYIDNTEYTIYTLTSLNTSATAYSQTFTATKPFKSIKVYMPTVSASSSNSIMTYFKYFKIENVSGLQIHIGTTPTTQYNYDNSTDGYTLLLPTKIVRHYWKYQDTYFSNVPTYVSASQAGTFETGLKISPTTIWKSVGQNARTQLTNQYNYAVEFMFEHPTKITSLTYQGETVADNWCAVAFKSLWGYDESTQEYVQLVAQEITTTKTTIDVPNNTFYKKYKVQYDTTWRPDWIFTMSMLETSMAGYTRTVIAGTEDDYDYYTEDTVYCGINQ